MLHYRPASILLICLLSLLPLGPAWAHQGATGVVKERMDAMKSMGKAMKAMSEVVKGKRPFDATVFSQGADQVLEHSAHLLMLFPEGSNTGKSEALAKIWQQWPKFEQQAQDSQREAQKLADLSAESDDFKSLRKQFVKLGKSCKSCHTDFRKPKD